MASRTKRVALALTLGATVTGLGGLLLLVAWVGWAAMRAAEVWPEGLGPLEPPEAALPVDPQDRQDLARVFEIVPEALDASELAEALEAEGPPPASVELPEGLEPAFEAMDSLVERSGLAMESWRMDEEPPPMLRLLALARARMVRAWRYAEADRPDEAMAEILRTHRLGLLLEQGGGNLLSTMVGVAVGQEALDELVELSRWERPPSDALLQAASAELEAALQLPSGLEAAILGECAGAELLYDEMRWWSREQLWATTSLAEPLPPTTPAASAQAGGPECCFPFYDADRTIQMARYRCRAVASQSTLPGSRRRFPDHEPLMEPSLLHPGPWLDNPVGRTLLEIATPSYEAFVGRGDTLRSRRALVLAWLALLRWQRAHPEQSPPGSLRALVPDYLAEPPTDPWDEAPLGYAAATRQLWTNQGSDTDGEPLMSLEF